MKINSKSGPLMSIMVNLTWSIITLINSTKTIFLLLKPSDKRKFCLLPFFFEIKLISVGSSEKKAKKVWLQSSRTSSKRLFTGLKKFLGLY